MIRKLISSTRTTPRYPTTRPARSFRSTRCHTTLCFRDRRWRSHRKQPQHRGHPEYGWHASIWSKWFQLNRAIHPGCGGVTTSYAGTLLQGDVVGFGYLYSGSVNYFDFTVQLTGGQIQPLFGCAGLLGLTMSSEGSTFTNSFTTAFEGEAKGYCGPDNLMPPTISCPPLSEVVTTAAKPNYPTNEGFIVTYPNPTATDNCNPFPTIFCDTPSGSSWR